MNWIPFVEEPMDSKWVVPVMIGIAAVGVGLYARYSPQYSLFEDRQLLTRGLDTPTVWIFYDDSDVNSRFWSDFGARSSRVLNLPFLNLCYQSIMKACGKKYHVEVISGLEDAAARLGGWDAMPDSLRNKRLPLRSEEMMYLRTAFLAKYGGLWVPASTIFVKELPELPKDKIVFFGSDPNETYAGPQGTRVPNTQVIWAGQPQMPELVAWSQALFDRLANRNGGKEVRRDQAWDYIHFAEGKSCVSVMPNAELTRKAPSGKKIVCEDILAAGTEGILPFPISSETLYVPIPYPEILKQHSVGWFQRMSEEQIMESDLVIKYLFLWGTTPSSQ